MAYSREEADDLIAAPKMIASSMQWRPIGNGYRLEAEVITTGPNPVVLRLVANCSTATYGFALLAENYPIRRYGVHAPHVIRGVRVTEPHKHRWDGRTEKFDWYYPDDIDPADDLTTQLYSFCNECNIEARDRIQGIISPFRGRT